MGKGICVAGNMIVDILYPVQGWPAQGELVHISDGITRATGGAVCNTIVDLARLDPEMKLSALGRVGTDPEGELVLETLGSYPNISTEGVIREGISSFTLVMNDTRAKQRTFFTYSGAGGVFCEDDIRWETLDCGILHIGYLLLLDALDQPDEEYGSRMARLLCHAQQRGLRTSIDVVSEIGTRFERLVPPALRYTDYCVINELEASRTTGIPLRDGEDRLLRENLRPALERMKALGVSTWAVIHAPEGGFGLDENGAYWERPSLALPEGYIRGTVGAGDAFCAGVLCGAEHGLPLSEAIDLGIGSAAASLSEANATDGLRPISEIRSLLERYPRQS